MKCPVDKSDMIVVEHRKIELDFCQECAGVWLDSGELELMIDVLNSEGADLSLKELVNRPAGQGKRRCPVCHNRMNKIWLGKKAEILIDRCPVGHGMWFDSGELQKTLSEMCASPHPDVISFLCDAFPVLAGRLPGSS